MTYKDFVAITDLFSISCFNCLVHLSFADLFGPEEINEEKYNLYFALFSFSLAGYIFIGALTYFNAFDDVLDKTESGTSIGGYFYNGNNDWFSQIYITVN